MVRGGASPYPYPPRLILPITLNHTRQWVQFFPIPVTQQGRWAPAGKITHICKASIWPTNSHKRQHIIIIYKQTTDYTTRHTFKQQHIINNTILNKQHHFLLNNNTLKHLHISHTFWVHKFMTKFRDNFEFIQILYGYMGMWVWVIWSHTHTRTRWV